MVKAELSYNPYLQETIVKFNGKAPRINSLVEKYQTEKLQSWINKIPRIFYDEMNGFDFELEFSGTKLDYGEIVDAFASQGISCDEVKIFHKNELCERETKLIEIKTLIQWLKENRNRRLLLDSFLDKNKELLNNTYPMVLVYGTECLNFSFNGIDISAETVTLTASWMIFLHLSRKIQRLIFWKNSGRFGE